MKRSIWVGYEVRKNDGDTYTTRAYFDLEGVKDEIADRHAHLTAGEMAEVDSYYANRYDVELADDDGRSAEELYRAAEDEELFDECSDADIAEQVSWVEPDGTFDVCLSNDSSIFDRARGFKHIEDALDWADGRGGKYVIQIGRTGVESSGISIAYDSRTKVYSYYDVCQWVDIPEDEIVEYIDRRI